MNRYFTALILALALLALPLCALAEKPNASDYPEPYQIEDWGGSTFFGGNPEAYEQDITVSKTISRAADDPENFFDITLDVETVSRRPSFTASDVVIVMDISNTMNNTMTFDDGVTNPKRIEVAKQAAKEVINYFELNSGLAPVRVGLVTFNTHAQRVLALTDIRENGKAAQMRTAIDGIVAPRKDSEDVNNELFYRVFTNIEGGLQLAYNMLKQAPEENYKYVIFLSDGFPTTYIKSGGDSDAKIYGYPPISKVKDASMPEGYFAYTLDPAGHRPSLYGTNYSDRGAKKAQAVAAEMKGDNINIFTIGVALGDQKIKNWTHDADGNNHGPGAYTVDTTDMKAGDSYTIGNDTEDYKAWLRDSISGGYYLTNPEDRYFDAPSRDKMTESISLILERIESAPLLNFNILNINDPMSEYIEFLHFYDKSGSAVLPTSRDGTGTVSAALSGSHTEMSETVTPEEQNAKIKENTASYSRSNDKFTWNLLKSAYTQTRSAETNWNYVRNYQLKYRVRLRNEAAGFNPYFGEPLLTNNATHLTWRFANRAGVTVGGTHIEPLEKIPQVEGYKGELRFKKVSAGTGDALAGAEFTLTHTASACPVCANEADFPPQTSGTKYVAVSGADGYVTFDNIPSGHTYTLVETHTPAGSVQVHDHIVTVGYGTTTVAIDTDGDMQGKDREIVDGTFTDTGDGLLLPNGTPTPVRLQLRLDKLLSGRNLKAGEFAFKLSGAAAHGVTIEQIVKNSTDGSIVFDPLLFDTASPEGKPFVYTITELIDSNPGDKIDDSDETVVYDPYAAKVYVKVYQDHNGAGEWTADVSFDGTNYTTYKGVKENGEPKVYPIPVPNPNGKEADFVNTLRPKAKAVLFIKKSIANFQLTKDSMDGKFAFELYDALTGISTVLTCNENGEASMDFTYDKSGEYRYTIRELRRHDDAPYDQDFVYDPAVWDVTVTVTRPDDLTKPEGFAASISYKERYTGKTGSAASFTNCVKDPVSLDMRATKVFNGKPPKKQAFTFELVDVTDGTETVLKTVTSTPEGLIDFGKLTYAPSPEDPAHSPSGEYRYIVREVIPEGGNTGRPNSIIYDARVYAVTVSVSDEGTAYSLRARVAVPNADGMSELVALYEGTNVSLVLSPEGTNRPILFENITVDIPETGDSKSLLPWMLLLILSGAALLLRLRRTH